MRVLAGASLVVIMTASTLNAKTVAWWPLAYENGVRTTVDTVLENKANPGTLDAQPISMDGDAIIAGSDTCPVGANAFPSGWGVWEPQSGMAVTGATGLYFSRPKNDGSGKGGAVRVTNPEGLRLQTFTFECFFKMAKNAYDAWNVIAVMPGKLATSTGAKVVNYDSWGLRVIGSTKLQFRYTKKTAEATDIENVGTHNVTKEITAGKGQGFAADVNFFDGKWHHVAFSVSAATHKANFYVDYTDVTSIDIAADGLSYGQEDFFIGATPQALGAFGGTIAHVRISDQALETPDFLSLSDLSVESEDVIFHADFETPSSFGLSSDYAAVNRGRGRTMLTKRVDDRPRISNHPADDDPLATVNVSLTNATALVNKRKLFCGAKARSFGRFYPTDSDNFTNSSFTVECFYKTTQSATWIPIVRRRGESGFQFNIGFGGTAGRIYATAFEYDASSGGSENKPVNDTEASNDGRWHHAALVVDAKWKKIAFYRDYKCLGTQTYNGRLVPPSGPVFVGGTDDEDKAFDGSVDDVRITMRALKPGEFLTGDYFNPATETLGWVGFEGTVNGAAGVLTNGTAEKAVEAGSVPVFEVHGRNPKIVDGANTVLKTDNVKALSFDKGVVKYNDNLLLPLFPEQTIEFMIKAGPQSAMAGVVRSNIYRLDAGTPAWGLSFANAANATALHLRCAMQFDTGEVEVYGINHSTGVIVGDNRWHHVAMTLKPYRDAEGAPKTTVCIYKDYGQDTDGKPSWTLTVGGWPFYGTGNASVWLGATSSTTSFFNGLLDELRISQGILEPSEFLRSAKNGMAILIR